MINKTNYEYLLSDLNSLQGVGIKTQNLLKKKNINNLSEKDLFNLEELLNIDDTNLYNFYNGFKTDFEFENNNINFLYKNFDYTQK